MVEKRDMVMEQTVATTPPSGPTSATKPSPQSVGREFVRQYYTLLNQAPLHLHRFYWHDSSFTHGGFDNGHDSEPVKGQQAIHQTIMQLNFRDCHAKIRQVDAHSTLGDGVVVQVSGELSNNGQAMRRFMQTFVLAPQSPKKFYVRNDIFRYQDEVFGDEMNNSTQSGNAVNTSSSDDSMDTSMVSAPSTGSAPSQPPGGGEGQKAHETNGGSPKTSMGPPPSYVAATEEPERAAKAQPGKPPGMATGTPARATVSLAAVDKMDEARKAGMSEHGPPPGLPGKQQLPQVNLQEPPPAQPVPKQSHPEPKKAETETETKKGQIEKEEAKGEETVQDAEPDSEVSKQQGTKETGKGATSASEMTYASLLKASPAGGSGAQTKPSEPISQHQQVIAGKPPVPGTVGLNKGDSGPGTGQPPPQIQHQHGPKEGYRGPGGGRGGSRGGGSGNYGRGGGNVGVGHYGRGSTERYGNKEEEGYGQERRRLQSTNSNPMGGNQNERIGPMIHYSDSQQLFVGNLPHNCTEAELEKLFSQFGKVADIRINNKGAAQSKTTPSGARVPNFGFVVFEDESSVEVCLKKRPIHLPPNEHRLNVEEKKNKYQIRSENANSYGQGANRQQGGNFERGSQEHIPSGGQNMGRGGESYRGRGGMNIRGGGRGGGPGGGPGPKPTGNHSQGGNNFRKKPQPY